MAALSLASVAAATEGALLSGDAGLIVERYAIDSRAVSGGELFFALVGPRHDGHDFLPEAFGRGAAAAVISRAGTDLGPTIRVADTTDALRRLAARARLDWGGPVVGITGSCGKTTTKEMTRQAVQGSLEVLATRGNLNNLFGLPLMLLELTPAHEAAILEMGISTPNEMAPLTAIARPDVAVLLNIAEVHLAQFASLDDLAATKLQILEGLRPEGTMVYNADDPRLAAAAARHTGKRLSFGLEAPADFSAGSIRDLGEEGIEAEARAAGRAARLRLRVSGRHNLLNALAALAAASVLGVPLADGAERLGAFRPLPMRGARRRLRGGVVLWDESYNSNPAALRAVLAALATTRPAGKRILVSGDMLELGHEERAIHAALAGDVHRAGVNLFIGVGPLSALTAERLKREFRIEALAAPDAEAAGHLLAARVRDHDLVVIKGSRAMATEKAAWALETARPEET